MIIASNEFERELEAQFWAGVSAAANGRSDLLIGASRAFLAGWDVYMAAPQGETKH